MNAEANDFMDACLTFSELLEYTAHETDQWRKWFTGHPEVLDHACDIAKAGTVRALLLHIFATELFFAHAVLELPPPHWENLPSHSIDDLFRVSEDARLKFQTFFSQAQSADWQSVKDLGFLKASKRKMVAQAFLHGIHHRGQLATFLRQRGLDGMWVHDLILTNVME